MSIRYDTYQGRINTISPAIGSYSIDTYINIDRGATGASGVTGTETLTALKYDQGVTGINGANFNNIKNGEYA